MIVIVVVMMFMRMMSMQMFILMCRLYAAMWIHFHVILFFGGNVLRTNLICKFPFSAVLQGVP